MDASIPTKVRRMRSQLRVPSHLLPTHTCLSKSYNPVERGQPKMSVVDVLKRTQMPMTSVLIALLVPVVTDQYD